MSKLILTTQISLVKSDDVEQVLQDVTVLHFSGGQAWECPSVSPLVSPLARNLENRSKDFAETWSEVKGG